MEDGRWKMGDGSGNKGQAAPELDLRSALALALLQPALRCAVLCCDVMCSAGGWAWAFRYKKWPSEVAIGT